ncbi:MAG: hypothetical protein ACRDHL_03875 [Candidatus Promineifilaceae bacterium]
MNSLNEAIRRQLTDISGFSELVIGLPLYGYQTTPLQAVLGSVLGRQGLEYLLVFPRQSGKNEAVAHLLVYLLNVLQRTGGNLVFGATGDGLGRMMNRLESRLSNPWNGEHWAKAARPARRLLGESAVVFLSTHRSAASRGETAHWLLVVDELQEQDGHHLEAVFEPMRAANNATALYIGTVKSRSDALWSKKEELEAAAAADGRQRVFITSAEEVCTQNPHYAAFLAAKVARFGRRHPIIASEYFNEPMDAKGGLFDERRLALMRGRHARQRAPEAPAGVYIATLDVAGQDEAAAGPLSELANPGRDYTVAHVFAVSPPAGDQAQPAYLAQDVFVDHGGRHFQDFPGRPKLVERLLAWLQSWRVAHLVADQSGVGQGLVDWLAARLGAERVTGYTFSPARKARLGSSFLSLIEAGRFKYWSGDEDRPLSDGWWFFSQARHCGYSVPAEGLFERDLRWGVPASARVSTPLGPRPVHDDRLISAALVTVADELWRAGKLRLGQAQSAVIGPADPLQDLGLV